MITPVRLEVELIARTVPTGRLAGKDAQELLAFAYAQSYQKDNPTTSVVTKYGIGKAHSAPLEFAWFVFHIRNLSRAGLAQLTRHRIASYEVESQRFLAYDEALRVVVPPTVEAAGADAVTSFLRAIEDSWRLHLRLKEQGVPKQDARFLFPNAAACNLVMGMNLRGLLNFWRLRAARYSPTARDAQWEIAAVANATADIVLGELPQLADAIRGSLAKGLVH